MKKPTSKRRQPIADKVLKRLKKELCRKVVDLSSVRAGREQAADLQKTIVSAEELQKLPPCFAAYTWVQNQLSMLAEQLLDLPELNRFGPVKAYRTYPKACRAGMNT